MTYVVDCSAVVEYLYSDLGAKVAERIHEHTLIAPQLLIPEVISTVRGLTLGRHIEADYAESMLADFSLMPIHLHSMESLVQPIWELRHNVSSYDAAYIALGRATSTPVLTCAGRLHRAMPQDTVLIE